MQTEKIVKASKELKISKRLVQLSCIDNQENGLQRRD